MVHPQERGLHCIHELGSWPSATLVWTQLCFPDLAVRRERGRGENPGRCVVRCGTDHCRYSVLHDCDLVPTVMRCVYIQHPNLSNSLYGITGCR